MKINDFKHNICIVEIENSSFCNRKCSYCLNSYVDRFTKNEIMPYELFQKIIDELSEMEYDRVITFHRYNEPFFNQNCMILDRISYARKKLPNASLVTSTNADYLDAKYLKKIKDSGLDSLYCQCHLDNYRNFTIDDIKELISKINMRIGGFKGKFVVTNDSCVFVTIGSGFRTLTIQCKNFIENGFDRGGVVKSVQKNECEGPCYHPLISFTIDYNGKVTSCLNTTSYCKEHVGFVIGDIKLNSITDIYESPRACELRQALLNGRRYEICKFCNNNYEKLAKKYEII